MNCELEVQRLRQLLERIVWHALAPKPPEQSPDGNRLQNVVAVAARGIGLEAVRRACRGEEPREES